MCKWEVVGGNATLTEMKVRVSFLYYAMESALPRNNKFRASRIVLGTVQAVAYANQTLICTRCDPTT